MASLYTVLPFDATSTCQRRKHYPLFLSDVARDCSDAVESLSQFADLMSGRGDIENSPVGYRAYDAHVGETACHIRAGMLMELYGVYQQSANEKLYLTKYIACLQQTQENAQNLCFQLTSNNACPTKFGLGSKLEGTDTFVAALGWIEPELKASHGVETETTSKSAFPEWNPGNPRLAVRYLIALFVLAKYTEHSKCSKTNHTIVRLQPKKAASYASELIASSWNQGNNLYKGSGCNRIEVRYKSLQKWVSGLCCSWVQVWAAKLSFSSATQTLVSHCIKSSPKGLQVVAAYVGFLACRRVWAGNRWPLLLVDRYFCSQGYHLNLFRATLEPAVEPPSASDHHIVSTLSWNLTQVRPEDIDDPSASQGPIICILGNSIAGSHEEYLARTLDGSPECCVGSCVRPHRDNQCAANVEHRQHFIGTDHDRLSQALLAEHRAYPFPFKEGAMEEDEVNELLDSIRQFLPNDPLDQYFLKSRSEVNDVGAGRDNMSTFRWEHILAESPRRLGRLLHEATIARRFSGFSLS
ncbi:hypothetical protein BJY04DRAFT_212260 [Aspergillus karnatakaensis]|uniref:uncharacterized protein n=1 Tax=Aspergillus karnatakaensis TaxID=1810916 RepID=UPI003CCD0A9B